MGVVIDANILNFFIVGLKGQDLISEEPSVCKNDPEAFPLLGKLFDYSRIVVISPYILPETSNTLPLDYRPKTGHPFKQPKYLAETLKFLNNDKIQEKYTKFKELISKDDMGKFGVTDASIIKLARDGYAVVTNDAPLMQYLQNTGNQAMNIPSLVAQNLLANL